MGNFCCVFRRGDGEEWDGFPRSWCPASAVGKDGISQRERGAAALGAATGKRLASVPPAMPSAFPTFIRPCRPVRAIKPPAGDAWLHEPKLDGYRLQIVKRGWQVKLYAKSGYDWSRRLGKLAEALAIIPCQMAVIDAELCFLATDGLPDFQGLKAAMGRGSHHQLAIFAFDILHRNGADLLPLPMIERRGQLDRLMARANVPCLRLVEAYDDGAKLLAAAERYNIEAIVSKRRMSPYRSGESQDWLKTKMERRRSWEPRRLFGR
jgi:bifunctional non-homologous end joining protein LigD